MRYLRTLSMAALALGLTAPAAEPQYATRDRVPATGRVTLEGFFSRQHLRTDRGERASLDGIGGRFLWSLTPPGVPGSRSLAERTAVGAFVISTPDDIGTRLRSWHYGVEAHVRLLTTPLAERVDPIFSLGLGALRTRSVSTVLLGAPHVVLPAEDASHATWPTARPLFVAIPRRSTDATITPGIGGRLLLSPDMAFRVDLRDAIVLRGGARHNVEVVGGMSVVL